MTGVCSRLDTIQQDLQRSKSMANNDWPFSKGNLKMLAVMLAFLIAGSHCTPNEETQVLMRDEYSIFNATHELKVTVLVTRTVVAMALPTMPPSVMSSTSSTKHQTTPKLMSTFDTTKPAQKNFTKPTTTMQPVLTEQSPLTKTTKETSPSNELELTSVTDAATTSNHQTMKSTPEMSTMKSTQTYISKSATSIPNVKSTPISTLSTTVNAELETTTIVAVPSAMTSRMIKSISDIITSPPNIINNKTISTVTKPPSTKQVLTSYMTKSGTSTTQPILTTTTMAKTQNKSSITEMQSTNVLTSFTTNSDMMSTKSNLSTKSKRSVTVLPVTMDSSISISSTENVTRTTSALQTTPKTTTSSNKTESKCQIHHRHHYIMAQSTDSLLDVPWNYDTVEECCEECLENENCKAFAYSEWSHRCWTMTGCGSRTNLEHDLLWGGTVRGLVCPNP